MASSDFSAKRGWLFHILAVLLFFVISAAYFYPVLGGKILVQGDTFKYVAMSKEIHQHRAEHQEEPLWTNSIFGGMPAYQISMKTPGNLFVFLSKIVPRPISFCFVAMLGAYVMLLSFGMNRWVAAAVALAYGLNTYFISFIEAGHNTKSDAVALMPFVIAGLQYLFQGRMAAGILITAIALPLQITVNHLQITYYMFLLIGIWTIAEAIRAGRQGQLKQFGSALGIFAIIAVMAVGVNSTRILTTKEYADWTIRGPSELSPELTGQQGSGTGLDRDYTFDWSYGIGETLTMMFANYAGGSSQQNFIADDNSASLDVLRREVSAGRISDQEAQNRAQIASKYWGPLSFTGGPIYVGAIIAFLFIAGCICAPRRYRGWLIAGTILAIMLGWGRHFPAFNYLMFDYFPLYNKFRTVMMAMVISDLTMLVLAGFALQFLLFGERSPAEKRKALFTAGGVTLTLALIPLSAGIFYSPESFREAAILASEPGLASYIDAIHQDRVQMIRADALRSLFFIAAAFGLIWLGIGGKLKPVLASAAIGLLVLLDLSSINKDYLNSENFKEKDYYEKNLVLNMPPIQDRDPHFRVLNANIRLDQDGLTPYAYHAVSGYHGAKSRRYQDLINIHNYNLPLPVLNMLNTRYVVGRNNQVQRNPAALGNAWTVDSIVWARDADAEVAAMDGFDPSRQVVIREEDRSFVADFVPAAPGDISLSSYKANELIYKVNNPNPVLAVFSEMYYRGNIDWVAYLNGERIDHFRVNYILRGMVLPAGEHELIFAFDPPSFQLGNRLSLAASVLLWLLAASSLVQMIRQRKEENESPA